MPDIRRPKEPDDDPGPTNVDKPDPGPNEESIHDPTPDDADEDDVLEDEEGIPNAS